MATTGDRPETDILKDPFASPAHSTSQSPARPEPALHKPARYDSDSSVAKEERMSGGPDLAYYDRVTIKEKSGSMSSVDKSVLSPTQSVDLNAKRSSRSSNNRKHHRVSRDLEKGMGGNYRTSHDQHRRSTGSRRSRVQDVGLEAAQDLQESHALKILLFLAGPCVILSFLNAMWTLVSFFITLLSQPVRLCARRPSFGQQLGGLLGPALNLQLKCIYTPLPPYANEDTSYHPMMLVAVQSLSPFLSLGVMVAAWIVAIFWISSLVVGDPAGTDRRDDGSETVLALRRFWEKWLCRSIRED